MEKLVNSDIIIDIEHIEMISGGDQYFEVVFMTKDNTKYKIVFDLVYDVRCSIESGYIDRFSKFIRAVQQKSSVLVIENSEYVNYFMNQASGTRPIQDVEDYILFDVIDTVIEVLTIKKPKLVKIEP